MTHVAVPGAELHTVRLGTAGSRVVMLHGLLLGHLGTWYFGAGRDLARSHRVLLYDLRGHGRSSRPPAGYDLATHTRDLEALLAPGPVSLVGHSWGALVALRFALDHPGRVHRLALVEAPLPPTAPAEIHAFLERPPAEMVSALPPALSRAVASGRRQAVRLVRRLEALATETTLLADLASTPPFDDADLAGLAVPTLLIYGRTSACRPAGAHLAAVLRRSELCELEGGHYLHLDDPVGLAAALVGFFAPDPEA